LSIRDLASGAEANFAYEFQLWRCWPQRCFHRPVIRKVLSNFGLLWYTLFIIPTLAVKEYDYGILYWEHRLPVPLAGFLIFFSELSWVKALDFRRFPNNDCFVRRSAVFGLYSISAQFTIFQTRSFFWERAVEESPFNSPALFSLANAYQSKNLNGLAEQTYRRALKINPKEPLPT